MPHWDGELDVTGKPPGRNTVLYVSEEAKDKGKKVSDTFKGSLDHGNKSGKGVYTFASGAKYRGEYSDDHNFGCNGFTYLDGSECEGRWGKVRRLSEIHVRKRRHVRGWVQQGQKERRRLLLLQGGEDALQRLVVG